MWVLSWRIVTIQLCLKSTLLSRLKNCRTQLERRSGEHNQCSILLELQINPFSFLTTCILCQSLYGVSKWILLVSCTPWGVSLQVWENGKWGSLFVIRCNSIGPDVTLADILQYAAKGKTSGNVNRYTCSYLLVTILNSSMKKRQKFKRFSFHDTLI